MYNWMQDKEEVINKTINSIMGELGSLVRYKRHRIESANYWIDNTHNVFGFVNSNGRDDIWIEVHFELYECNGEQVGDLAVFDTNDLSYSELYEIVEKIVKLYYCI